jgi:hypothetical protein
MVIGEWKTLYSLLATSLFALLFLPFIKRKGEAERRQMRIQHPRPAGRGAR